MYSLYPGEVLKEGLELLRGKIAMNREWELKACNLKRTSRGLGSFQRCCLFDSVCCTLLPKWEFMPRVRRKDTKVYGWIFIYCIQEENT